MPLGWCCYALGIEPTALARLWDAANNRAAAAKSWRPSLLRSFFVFPRWQLGGTPRIDRMATPSGARVATDLPPRGGVFAIPVVHPGLGRTEFFCAASPTSSPFRSGAPRLVLSPMRLAGAPLRPPPRFGSTAAARCRQPAVSCDVHHIVSRHLDGTLDAARCTDRYGRRCDSRALPPPGTPLGETDGSPNSSRNDRGGHARHLGSFSYFLRSSSRSWTGTVPCSALIAGRFAAAGR